MSARTMLMNHDSLWLNEEYIMSDLILNETKRVLFKAGSYIVATPKGNTSHWAVADWIMYIDKNGEWVQ
ncbi:hypothetical protein IPGJFKPH_00143 [Klebsiella phage vB_KoM-Pickle]|nr:hypothetical protein OJNDCHOG_00830 [Klebsiella phage 150040]WDQ26421.1 hypothetical protein phiKPNS3_00155 [Klebsiella phage phi_KPN_S3]WKN59655.1 hypothetical protein ayl_00072 [Klebsiella phage AYL]WNA09063.1 hypothetical protein [Klebsiella phage P61_1]CAD5242136.1 hypothetical protein IPGJFKPH_00143 [Klebsiella phage vB_KoM-Pickle]CAD5242189.1 hypothetical protein EHPPICDA_00149 [Klebsiella phage vB_KpM-SoFaint]CAD6025448.1 hypothetical protein FADJDIKG_00138 [Klebsiella phage vB_KoM-